MDPNARTVASSRSDGRARASGAAVEDGDDEANLSPRVSNTSEDVFPDSTSSVPHSAAAYNFPGHSDHWNQSLKLGVMYDRDSDRAMEDNNALYDVATTDELYRGVSDEQEQVLNKVMEPLAEQKKKDEDDEDDAKEDERALDEMIGLDEEFAGDDNNHGPSRIQEAAQQPKEVSPSQIPMKYWTRIFTWSMFRFCLRFTIGLGFALGAGFVDETLTWSGVPSWRWLVFGSAIAFSYDFSSLVVVGSLRTILARYWYKSSAMKNTHYYLSGVRVLVSMLLASLIWLISWWLCIGLVRPDTDGWSTAYDYVVRALGSIVLWIFLLALASISKEVAESIFERTTHWNDVERILKCEYFIWHLASCGTLIPHDVVAAFVLSGWRETKADPQVLRQCTRYISKTPMTAFTLRGGETIQIRDMDDAGDFGEALFDRVTGELPVDNLIELLRDNKREREDKTNRLFKAYGYMMQGRSKLVASLQQAEMDHASSAGGLPSADSWNADMQEEAEKERKAKAANDLKRKIKFSDVERAYTDDHMHSVPEFAPDAMFGWKNILDVAQRGHGSVRSFRAALIRFFQDRANVAATLRDAHAAVERLGIVLISVAHILAIVFIALIFAGSSSYEVWLGLTSFFVAVAVIFGGMLAQVFESIVFLFVRHAYDVGDLIVIDDDYYSVRRLELLTTLLLKWSGQYMIVENQWLSKQQVLNLTRSGLYWHSIETAVDMATCTSEFLHGVRATIKQFIEKKPESFSGEFQVSLSGMDRPLHVIVSLWIEFSYRPNNLERLCTDIGRAYEAVCLAMRVNGATSSGVPRAAIHIGQAQPPSFLTTANKRPPPSSMATLPLSTMNRSVSADPTQSVTPNASNVTKVAPMVQSRQVINETITKKDQ